MVAAQATTAPSWFDHLLAACLPIVPRPIVRWVSMRYVAGETAEDMVRTVRELNQKGMRATVDLLGEFITDLQQAHNTCASYQAILKRLHDEQLDANISIKLSALGLLLDEGVCTQLVRTLVETAAQHNNFVRIDMEDTPCTDATLRVYTAVRREFPNVGIVMQAYLRRTLGDVRSLMAQGMSHFRLCKGIYREPHALAYQTRELINANYALVLEDCFRGGAFVGIATHDEALVWHGQRLIDQYRLGTDRYEFQMLLGVTEPLRDLLVQGGHPVRIYVPFGGDWYAYCLRRLRENPTVAGHVFRSLLARVLGKVE